MRYMLPSPWTLSHRSPPPFVPALWISSSVSLLARRTSTPLFPGTLSTSPAVTSALRALDRVVRQVRKHLISLVRAPGPAQRLPLISMSRPRCGEIAIRSDSPGQNTSDTRTRARSPARADPSTTAHHPANQAHPRDKTLPPGQKATHRDRGQGQERQKEAGLSLRLPTNDKLPISLTHHHRPSHPDSVP
ncbi:hypothetical protein C8F01DRAFT_692375 [Mycena amicta]|nr:hypothetical protein C8F01DRAFT_692375 [Mycena amicta]